MNESMTRGEDSSVRQRITLIAVFFGVAIAATIWFVQSQPKESEVTQEKVAVEKIETKDKPLSSSK